MSISVTTDAPHIRHHENTRGVIGDAVITMLFLYAMAYYYYGFRVVILAALSAGTALVSDLLCTLIARRRVNIQDISPLVTGLLLPLLMPASISYSIVITAAVFSIVVAKHPFGGVGHNVFNPAAAGFSFVAICFPDRIFSYPQPLQALPLESVFEFTPAVSAAFTLDLGGMPKYDPVEILLGNYPGPMGATNILVIITCLLFLVFRNTVRWNVPVFFFATVALFAFVFPRTGVVHPDFGNRLSAVYYELTSGMLLLGGVFMLGDPVTTPKRSWSKTAFAVTAGLVVMLFRWYGGLEEGFTFAVLLMNATVWGFDMAGETVASRIRRRRSA